MNYSSLPLEVQDAYYKAYQRKGGKPHLINLDSTLTEFSFVKNTSIEIIKAGKEIYAIDNRQFYIPWHLSKEISPYILHGKIFYCIVRNNKSWNTHTIEQLKRNQFLEIDISK